jgi:hypothetical protein
MPMEEVTGSWTPAGERSMGSEEKPTILRDFLQRKSPR